LAFNAAIVTAVQTRLSTYGTGSKLLQYVEAVDVLEAVVVNNSGTITVGGVGLTNQQYQQLYEMLV